MPTITCLLGQEVVLFPALAAKRDKQTEAAMPHIPSVMVKANILISLFQMTIPNPRKVILQLLIQMLQLSPPTFLVLQLRN
jgi:hypothetical protein